MELEDNSTKQTETKLQNLLGNLKSNMYLKEQDYKYTYPKKLRPGIFYGIARVHKLKENDTVDNLSLRPIISNVEKSNM